MAIAVAVVMHYDTFTHSILIQKKKEKKKKQSGFNVIQSYKASIDELFIRMPSLSLLL
jgi:hypothetical protein